MSVNLNVDVRAVSRDSFNTPPGDPTPRGWVGFGEWVALDPPRQIWFRWMRFGSGFELRTGPQSLSALLAGLVDGWLFESGWVVWA